MADLPVDVGEEPDEEADVPDPDDEVLLEVPEDADDELEEVDVALDVLPVEELRVEELRVEELVPVAASVAAD